MPRRPLIGITPTPTTLTFDHGTFYRYCLSDTYVRSVWQAGGNPMILPWISDRPADLLDAVDGLVLSGGGDIDPSLFEQERHAMTYGIDDARDAFEIALMREAVERDVPTLAICRGIQVMNVALGGTLHQHVPELSGDLEHRQNKAGFSQDVPSHRVALENTPNPISDLLGKDELMVNSFHHQSISEVAASLMLAGRSEDGVIEAVYHPGMRFAIGVQWHPEMLAANHPDHARLFEALVEVARTAAAATR
jgi:putative glutamine amidotransferase